MESRDWSSDVCSSDLPSVSADGVLSFAQSASITPPTAVNIKGPKGDTGSQGIQGIQGVKGDKGDTGEKGTDGINGTNGADGKSAYEVAVLNGFVGSQSDWLLSLKGEQGIQGIQGIQGLQGLKGDKGDTGATGQAGAFIVTGKQEQQV